MAEDGGSDALSFGFVSIVRGKQKIWTLGMHVLGFPDLELQNADGDEELIVESLRYVCRGDKPVGDGHVFADEHGPKFQVVATTSDKFDADSPMYNPWGRFSLRSIRNIAERN